MNLLGRLRPGRPKPAAGMAVPSGRTWTRRSRPARGAYRTHRPTPSARCCCASTATPTGPCPTKSTGSPDASSAAPARPRPGRTPVDLHHRTVAHPPLPSASRRAFPPAARGHGIRAGKRPLQPPARPSRPGAVKAGGTREAPRIPDRVHRRDPYPRAPHRGDPGARAPHHDGRRPHHHDHRPTRRALHRDRLRRPADRRHRLHRPAARHHRRLHIRPPGGTGRRSPS